MTAEEIQRFARASRETLEGIHGTGFVHCDIKPEDILLQNLYDIRSVVIADFGLSRKIPSDDRRLKGRFGTSLYQAPELFSTNEEFTSLVDIWAFGMSPFRLFTGKSYFRKPETICNWTEAKPEKIFREDLKNVRAPLDAIDAILNMLTFDPAERPTAARLMDLDYFNGIDAPITRDTKGSISGLAPGVED
jgi:calcium/calmodulin-dependent protein kinase I